MILDPRISIVCVLFFIFIVGCSFALDASWTCVEKLDDDVSKATGTEKKSETKTKM